MKSKIQRLYPTVKQASKYGTIGMVINVVGYCIYLLLTYLGTSPKIAFSVLYVTGTVISFASNRSITFSHSDSIAGSGLRFLIAYSFGYLINLLLILFFVDTLGFPHQYVQLAAIIVVASYLFIALKFFVFN